MSDHVIILLSALISALTTAVVILEIYAILAIKMGEHLQRLNYLRQDAIFSRDAARKRYEQTRKRQVRIPCFIE